MILQDAEYTGLMIGLSILIWIILFIVGILVTKWRARKKGWNEEWKPAIILNLFWLVVGIVCVFIPYGFIVSLIICLFVGAIVASKLYEKEYGESLVFIIIVWIFLIIIYIILIVILLVIVVAVIIGAGAAGGAGGSSNGGSTTALGG